jgi:hypothetical protein
VIAGASVSSVSDKKPPVPEYRSQFSTTQTKDSSMHPNAKRAAKKRIDAYVQHLRDLSTEVEDSRVNLTDWLKKTDPQVLPPKLRKIFKEALSQERTLLNAAIALEWTLDDYEELY